MLNAVNHAFMSCLYNNDRGCGINDNNKKWIAITITSDGNVIKNNDDIENYNNTNNNNTNSIFTTTNNNKAITKWWW